MTRDADCRVLLLGSFCQSELKHLTASVCSISQLGHKTGGDRCRFDKPSAGMLRQLDANEICLSYHHLDLVCIRRTYRVSSE